MRVVLITHPEPRPNEAGVIRVAIKEGLFRAHVRRPNWSADELRSFLDHFDAPTLERMVLHDHPELAEEYPLGGIHFNQRTRLAVAERGCSSCSCHTLEEVKEYKASFAYLFLSPIFDSISKEGYTSRFTLDELRNARGIIDEKVIALGGVSLERLPLLNGIPFGGVALLGDVWQAPDPVMHLRQYLSTNAFEH